MCPIQLGLLSPAQPSPARPGPAQHVVAQTKSVLAWRQNPPAPEQLSGFVVVRISDLDLVS